MKSLAAGAAALVVLSACGGSASTLTKQQYAAKLSQACAAFASAANAVGEPNSVASVAAHGQRIAALFAATIERRVAQLRPPPALAGLNRRLIALAERQHTVLVALARTARRSDLVAFQRLVARNARVNAEAAAVARQVGATACSGP